MQSDILDDFNPKVSIDADSQQDAKTPNRPFSARIHIGQGFFENFSQSEKQLADRIQRNDMIPLSAKRTYQEQIPDLIIKANVKGQNLGQFLMNSSSNFDYKNLQKYNTLDNFLQDKSLGSFDKVTQIQEQNRVYGTKDANDELIIFRDFDQSFSDKLEGNKYIMLSLNLTKLNQGNNLQGQQINDSKSDLKYHYRSSYIQNKLKLLDLQPFGPLQYVQNLLKDVKIEFKEVQNSPHNNIQINIDWLFKYPTQQ